MLIGSLSRTTNKNKLLVIDVPIFPTETQWQFQAKVVPDLNSCCCFFQLKFFSGTELLRALVCFPSCDVSPEILAIKLHPFLLLLQTSAPPPYPQSTPLSLLPTTTWNHSYSMGGRNNALRGPTPATWENLMLENWAAKEKARKKTAGQ